MAYIFLDVEPFDPSVVRDSVSDLRQVPVRRPFMGLIINKETHATLQVVGGAQNLNSASWFQLINSSSVRGEASGTSNFIITTVRHARKEAVQLVQTFSKTFLYLFGDTPRYLNVQGVLLKSENFPWKTEWLRNYDERMRASQTVQATASVYLTVENIVYEGQMLGCDIVDQADSPNMCPVSFLMYLTNVIYADVGPAHFPNTSWDRAQPVSEAATRVSRSEYIHLPLSERRRLGISGMDPAEQSEYYIDSFGNLGSTSLARLRKWEIAQHMRWLDDGRSFTESAVALQRLFDSRVGGYSSRVDEFSASVDEL